MLIFRNPGLIDLEAVRTLGVSVKLPGSFGRFGTGLKFAIATILRGGGQITIYRGLEEHRLATETKVIRSEPFEIVTLDGVALGITTQLGRDWEPWMVLRELGCNALDEGGDFGTVYEMAEFMVHDEVNVALAPDSTTITVDWSPLDLAYAQRNELFLSSGPTAPAPLFADAHLRIRPGPSAHLFYRGVRVYKLPKPSLLTYDILDEQRLTEDRTLAYTFLVDRLLVDTYLQVEEPHRELLRQVLTAEDGYYESTLKFNDSSWSVKPSKTFLAVAVDIRESRRGAGAGGPGGGSSNSSALNETARKILLRHMRDAVEEESSHGSYRRVVDDSFTYAREQLAALGIVFADDQAFIVVDELPGDAATLLESGRVYLLASLLRQPAREIILELLARWVDLNLNLVGSYDVEAAVRLLAPFVVGQMKDLVEDERLVREDRAQGVVPEELSLAEADETAVAAVAAAEVEF